MAEARNSGKNGGVIPTAESDTKAISQAQELSATGMTKNNKYHIAEDFEDMNLREEVVQSIKARGFTKPTPLQQRAVVAVTLGYDVVAHSCPGGGKRTIISFAVLQIISINSSTCQALVLTPTASAAEYTKQSITDIGERMNIQCHVCTGERRLKEDIQILRQGVHVVIGTLERIYDLVNRNVLKKCEIKLLVIEEADKMLSCASKRAICDMIKTLNSNVQQFILTQHVDENILSEFRNILRHPVFFATKDDVRILENSKHFYIPVSAKHIKLEILLALYKKFVIKHALIFCQTDQEARRVAKNMKTVAQVAFLVNSLSQKERNRIIQEFHTGGDIHTLITTDSHNFGDVQQASLVINYDFPPSFEKYEFRICRKDDTTVTISFMTQDEQQMLQSVQRYYQINKMVISNTDLSNFLDSVSHCLQVKDNPEKHLPVCNSFEELNLRKELLEGIHQFGFRDPTSLQRNAIIPCINGYDVIIHGFPRGSKTTTLAIAVLQNADDTLQCCQALVLTSTRDKAQYMYEFLKVLGRCTKFKYHVFYGGKSTRTDLSVLEKFAHIIVGTAGRIMDLINRKALRTNKIKMLVLEDASALFSEMQRGQTDKIFQALNSDIQIIASSTIFQKDAATQFKQFSKEPVCIVTRKNEISARNIKQFYLPLKRGEIFETVSNLYIKLTIPQSVIVCNKNETVKDSQTCLTGLTESNFLYHIKSEEKEILKNFCSVCNHTLFSTTLLRRKKQNRISVIVNYDFLIQKQNYLYDSNTSYYHKAIVADITSEKEMTEIQELKHFL